MKALSARQRGVVLQAVERNLLHEPLQETRNRKPLRPNPVAPWELRVGSLRVFYEVAEGEPDVVRVLAVGQKQGNVLRIAGREVEL
ncbi:MAG: type II toxin-antitoxin system RelE/ParE family toxin [Nitrospiraceae bacterium]|nr:MAG: type II toxin-antitoxin system RelE/ParE family toxin [Nitrospiraceae bacterium]